MILPDKFLKITLECIKPFEARHKTKAIKDEYVMLEYIVIKVPSTKLNNKHHAGNYMSRTNDKDLFNDSMKNS